MAMEFGKLNFAVGFNRTSAFPLDANSYFETYNDAVTAAAGATEVGLADSAYYIGQLIIVKDTEKGVGLYQIGADKKLVKFGQASSADELAGKVSELETRCANIEGKLILASETVNGFMSKEDFTKLAGVAEGAQVNVIEKVQINGTDLAVTDKTVNIETEDLSDILSDYVTNTNLTTELNKKVDKVDGKGLSTNDYTNADQTQVGKVAGLVTDVESLKSQITGLSGAMHFIGTSTTDPSTGATIEGHENFAAGDVCLYGKKEYVYDGSKWVELGDEGSHVLRSELDAYLKKEDAASTYATQTSLKGVSDRVGVIEGDYLKAADKTELTTSIATKADASDLTALETTVNGLNGSTIKVNGSSTTTLEDALKEVRSNSKVSVSGEGNVFTAVTQSKNDGIVFTKGINVYTKDEIDDKLVQTGADVLVKKVTSEFSVSNEGELSVAAIAQSKVTGLTNSLNTINGNIGDIRSGLSNTQALVGNTESTGNDTLFGRVKALEAKTEFISSVDTDQLSVTNAKLSIKAVSTDLLTQGDNTLVLNGGGAE